jgi:hypothetical protein
MVVRVLLAEQSPKQRQMTPNEGWQRVSPDELIQILIKMGAIKWD